MEVRDERVPLFLGVFAKVSRSVFEEHREGKRRNQKETYPEQCAQETHESVKVTSSTIAWECQSQWDFRRRAKPLLPSSALGYDWRAQCPPITSPLSTSPAAPG